MGTNTTNTSKQDLATVVDETVAALKTMGSSFSEKLADVLKEAHRGSGYWVARHLLDLAQLADKGNMAILREGFAPTIFDLRHIPTEERTLHLLGCFRKVIDEQRKLNGLPPLAEVL